MRPVGGGRRGGDDGQNQQQDQACRRSPRRLHHARHSQSRVLPFALRNHCCEPWLLPPWQGQALSDDIALRWTRRAQVAMARTAERRRSLRHPRSWPCLPLEPTGMCSPPRSSRGPAPGWRRWRRARRLSPCSPARLDGVHARWPVAQRRTSPGRELIIPAMSGRRAAPAPLAHAADMGSSCPAMSSRKTGAALRAMGSRTAVRLHGPFA